MSVFSQVESGTTFHRSRFTRSISNRIDYDCQFHQLIPVLKRFVLPGDIWKIGGDVLVRFLPMRTPTLTPNNFRVRYFFVPLRLIESNTELILTGSKDGHLYSGTIPVFDNFVKNANKVSYPDAYKVKKHSFWDYMNVQCLDYENIKNDECLPANYWLKAYKRIIWDYYTDENISYVRQYYADFDTYIYNVVQSGADQNISFSSIAKDYFTSSLPWQLKATAAPSILMSGTMTAVPNFGSYYNRNDNNETGNGLLTVHGKNSNVFANISNNVHTILSNGGTGGNKAFYSEYQLDGTGENTEANRKNMLEVQVAALENLLKNMTVTSTMGFDANDERTMFAETRIFERLARAGSRYTEYLRSNFGVSPADDTLQRPQYLGGWKIPIVTTEVLQTAQGTDPVGTMRGHGITRGGNRINTFFAKEFGVIFGLAEVRPDVQYTTGIPRQLTYKRRFDFFNPSLQHLSEQEVRNGELFISNSDGKNDDTFGFQAYGNELRSSQNETVGELRDTLADWNQALAFNSRPNLNNALISGDYNKASFNRPFVVQGATAYPIIVQFYNNLDVYRPMVRYATPGLVDHL